MRKLNERVLLLSITLFLTSCLSLAANTEPKPVENAITLSSNTCPVAGCYSPNWSPDSSQIVFRAKSPSKYGPLVIANADLSQFKPLLPGTEASALFPAPTMQEGASGVITSDVHVVTETVLVVTAVPGKYPEGTYSQPTWSPDGRHIAFEFTPFEEISQYPRGVYIVDTDGQNLQLVAAYNVGSSSGLHWARNGRQLYYILEDESGKYWAARVNVDGTNQERLVGFEHPTSVVWSPDDSKMAYDSAGDIFVMNLDGTGKRNLTNNPPNERNVFAFDWSPDGERLVYNTSLSDTKEGRLYVIRADGTGKSLIDSQRRYNSLAWSPDGKWLLLAENVEGNHSKLTKLPMNF
jgi:Tol biopolymer transport system component